MTLLLSGGATTLYIRWRIMGTGPPAFTEVDNPASFADSLFVRVSCKIIAFFLRVKEMGCLKFVTRDRRGTLALVNNLL